MPTLKLSSGCIHYATHPLYLGCKKINKNIAKENLLLLKTILDSKKIPFGIIAGTLLGAVREHDFIDHDEDVDLFLMEEYKMDLFDILPEILTYDFKIARYDRRGLLSLIRNDEYIDLYFFKKYTPGILICSGWILPEHFLRELSPISFLGTEFMAPKDIHAYLRYEYGDQWMVPIAYTDFNINKCKVIIFKYKELMKDKLPDWLYFLLAKYSERKMIKKYMQRISPYL